MRIVCFANGLRGDMCVVTLNSLGHDVTEVGNDVDLSDLPDADLYVLAGYNKILKPEVFNKPKFGTINLHGGKLPEYRGCAPINWQIINGENRGGCCILHVDEGIDTGNIIKQKFYDISCNDTAADVIKKQLQLFPLMLKSAISKIENRSIGGEKQCLTKGKYYTRRYPKDSHLNWNQSLTGVYNFIRALQGPYPPAYNYCCGDYMEINQTQCLDEYIKGPPGRIVRKTEKGYIVCCADRALLVTDWKGFMKTGEDLN